MPKPRFNAVLVLPLRRKWFEQIRDGKKPFEFRLKNDYWTKRLVGKSYDKVVFTLGYPPKSDTARRIEAPCRGYQETTVTSPEWDNEPREVFAIYTPCHPCAGSLTVEQMADALGLYPCDYWAKHPHDCDVCSDATEGEMIWVMMAGAYPGSTQEAEYYACSSCVAIKHAAAFSSENAENQASASAGHRQHDR